MFPNVESGIANGESAWCEIKVSDVTLLKGGVDRFPGVPDRTKLLLDGDINLGGIDCDYLFTGSKEIKSCDILFDIMHSF